MITFTKSGDEREIIAALRSTQSDLKPAVMKFLKAVSIHAAERAQLNAPILTGALTVNIKPMGVYEAGDMLITGVYTTLPYGYYLHEHQTLKNFPVPEPLDVAPKPAPWLEPPRLYGLGPITRTLDTPEGGAGGKFIARVINYWANTYLEWLRMAVFKVFSGRA